MILKNINWTSECWSSNLSCTFLNFRILQGGASNQPQRGQNTIPVRATPSLNLRLPNSVEVLCVPFCVVGLQLISTSSYPDLILEQHTLPRDSYLSCLFLIFEPISYFSCFSWKNANLTLKYFWFLKILSINKWKPVKVLQKFFPYNWSRKFTFCSVIWRMLLWSSFFSWDHLKAWHYLHISNLVIFS